MGPEGSADLCLLASQAYKANKVKACHHESHKKESQKHYKKEKHGGSNGH